MRRRTVTEEGAAVLPAVARRRTLLVVAAVLIVACSLVALDASAQRVADGAGRVGHDEAVRLFAEANDLYAEGSHGPAAELYETIIEGGFLNAEVYYNLANARYMEGEIAQAVLGYERALRLDGGHEDAAANLEFVREQLADRQVRVGGAMTDAADTVFRRAHAGRLAVLTSLCYFLVVAFVVTGVLRGGFSPWLTRAAVVTLVALVVFGALFGYRLHREGAVSEAVVVAADVPVRTGPGEDFVLEFRLHEGTKIRVREVREDWARVSVEGTDLEGWLPARSVEEI
jgi:hypothetical protein